jgi:hypothetical protein
MNGPDIVCCIDEPTRWDNPVPLLLVRGWCFARSGPSVRGMLARWPGGLQMGIHGLERPDVEAHFAGQAGAARSGFALRFGRPPRPPADVDIVALLEDGTEVVLRTVRVS